MIWLLPVIGRVPRVVWIPIVVLTLAAVVHFGSQIAMVTGGVSRSNAVEALAGMGPAAGFTEENNCPGLKDCFQSPIVVEPATAASASALLSRFGLSPSSVSCHTSPAGVSSATLRCEGSGTVNGTPLDFSLASGAGSLAGSAPSQPNAGTAVTITAPSG